MRHLNHPFIANQLAKQFYIKAGILLAIILSSNYLASQATETKLVEFHGHNFYHISNSSNNNVLVFLHGGVSNPVFDDSNGIPKPNYLIEDNSSFITSAIARGFDLLLPVTDDTLVWLNNH